MIDSSSCGVSSCHRAVSVSAGSERVTPQSCTGWVGEGRRLRGVEATEVMGEESWTNWVKAFCIEEGGGQGREWKAGQKTFLERKDRV